MHLVDDIHTHLYRGRGIDGLVAQHTHVVDTVVGGCVNFHHIHAAAGVDALTGRADIAGISVVGIFTVDRLGQDFGAGGLAGASGTCEQIRMADLPRGKLGLEGLRDRTLAHHLVEGLGAIFSIKRLIHAHASFQNKNRPMTRLHTHL